MLAMNRHGPFSEYELTAENESPSLFLFLGKAGGCSCSCAGAPATGSGVFSCSGTLGRRWRVESGLRASAGGATVVWKLQWFHHLGKEKKWPKTQHYRGLPHTELDSGLGVRQLKRVTATPSASHGAISRAKLLVQVQRFESGCVMNW